MILINMGDAGVGHTHLLRLFALLLFGAPLAVRLTTRDAPVVTATVRELPRGDAFHEDVSGGRLDGSG